MPGYKRKRYGSYSKTSKRRRTYRKSALKKIAPSRTRRRNFTKAVKKLIQSTAEKKRTSVTPKDYSFLFDGDGTPKTTNEFISRPVDLTSEFLTIPNGNQDGERIGEQLRTHKAHLKLLIQQPAGLSACVLQIWIGHYKETPGDAPTTAQLARIFDDGASVAPANGRLISLLYSNNTDEFSIRHYRKLKIGAANATSFVNNDFSSYRTIMFDLTKALGVLKYKDNTALPPTNKHIYMWMNWVAPDGGYPDNLPPRVQYYLDYTFTDM